MSDSRQGGPGRGLELFRIAGIRIRIDVSWLLIFALVLWSISAGYLPHRFPDLETGQYWAAGLVATLLFFVSILIHELAHSLVAKRAGLHISEITLFLFGGVSRMAEEPRSPGLEFRIAVVGPLASFALAGLFAGVAWLAGDALGGLSRVVVEYLAWINAALGVFNLLPGFPLDGGRAFRALVWWRTGSLRRATRLASNIGQGFALALMALGALQLFSGALVGGLWLIFIGMFLRGLASAGYEQLAVRQALEGVDVADVMVRDPRTVSPDLTLRRLVDEHLLRDGVRGYPVVEGGAVRGVVGLENLQGVSPEDLEGRRVSDVLSERHPGMEVAPDASLADALRQMAEQDEPRLLVMRGGRLVGLLTRGGVRRLLEVREVLPRPEERPDEAAAA